jgi:hypothetical protein
MDRGRALLGPGRHGSALLAVAVDEFLIKPVSLRSLVRLLRSDAD